MSDEMVQGTTEHTEETEETVTPTVTAPVAVTDEPAPAHSVAASDADNAPAPVASAVPATEPASDKDEFAQAMEQLEENKDFMAAVRQLASGDVINGTVMRIDREGVYVDVGAKSEGIIRLSELTRDPNALPEDIVKVGETIRVVVVEPVGRDGSPLLSKRRADAEQAWDKIEAARASGEIIQAIVQQRVKGGLVVNLGMRGFVPASHVGSGSLKVNLDRYIGQTIPLKVIEVDKDRQKIVLSNKLAIQEERETKSAELKANLAPEQRRLGTVRRLTPYGAFVDLGGIDGLLHISEMSWTRINDPKEILKEGQEVEVMVLKVDLENDRVSLGLKQIQPDPWKNIAENFKEGDVITGKVTRIVPFGAFVQVEGGIEGIIPNAEMPRNRGGKGIPPPNVDDEVEVKVISVRPDERKMSLSMKALQPPEEVSPNAPRESSAPADSNTDNRGGADSGRRNRRGGGRRDDEEDDFPRYNPAREEPRFTIGDMLGDAIAQQRKDRKEKARRARSEREEDESLEGVSEAELLATSGAEETPVIEETVVEETVVAAETVTEETAVVEETAAPKEEETAVVEETKV